MHGHPFHFGSTVWLDNLFSQQMKIINAVESSRKSKWVSDLKLRLFFHLLFTKVKINSKKKICCKNRDRYIPRVFLI